MNEQIHIDEIMKRAKSLFFVGIGGISMSSLAFVCRRRGYIVAGSDRAYSAMTSRLEEAGIPICHTHAAGNIEGFDAVIYTGAVDFKNPELAAAASAGVPVIYRADLLGYIMRIYTHRIGVAGMHGKSTCTSMLSHLFMDAGRKPTVLSGAETREMGGAYTVGEKEYFIFEACEYKDSFLHFFPTCSVILSIDVDHTDYFTGGLPQIKESFLEYASLPFEGDAALPFSVVCADDANIRAMLPELKGAVTFGIDSEDATYRATNISEARGRFSFDLMRDEEFLCRIALSVVGRHHIYNALASAAVGHMLGLSPEEISRGLSGFEGLLRRFEYKGFVSGAEVYIDYAHHPREITAVLEGARKMTRGRLIAFFEPHTYTRTEALFDEFARAFSDADEVYFLDIYAAREVNTSGVSSRGLSVATPRGHYVSSYEEAAHIIRETAKAGDTVMILGAGTVDRVADLALS